MVKVIIFDFGGVVKNNSTPKINSLIAKKFNLDFFLVEKSNKKNLPDLEVGEINSTEFWERICSYLAKKSKFYLPIKDVKKFWKKLYHELTEINKEVEELISGLKKLNYELAVLSNTIKHHAKYNRENGRFNKFDKVILSCEVGFRKPDIKIYELALKEFGVEPKECIFIDDKKENLIPAQGLGMNTILFESPDQLKNDLINMRVLNF